jgi:trimethylamine---corrinoid protein Co-methyltransferase
VRVSHVTDVFRQEPDGFGRVAFGFLTEAEIDYIKAKVVVQSCVESLRAANMSIQLMKRGWRVVAHTYGSGLDRPNVDHQSMAERAMIAQTVALAGADILGGVGQLECATVFSPVQAVLDNEIGGKMRRFIRKPSLELEALNWDEFMHIRTGEHFLDSAHTIATCRDQVVPKVFQRQGFDGYEKSGRRAAFDAARDHALAAIAAAPVEGHLSEDQTREIASLAAHADITSWRPMRARFR